MSSLGDRDGVVMVKISTSHDGINFSNAGAPSSSSSYVTYFNKQQPNDFTNNDRLQVDDMDRSDKLLNKNDNDVGLHPQVTKVFQQTEHVNKISIVKCRRQIRRKTFLGISPLLNCYKERKKLFTAIGNHDVETVEALLESGVSVNSCDEKLRTPLHVATASADEHIVKLLLQHGADTSKKDIIGSTCLHLAACNCNIPIITLLLQHGADIRTLDSTGKNPMQLVFGKLKCLRESRTYSSERLKCEISAVISLMKAYLKNEKPGMMETLDGLSKTFNSASLEDEIVTVGDLLSDLTNLRINDFSSN